MKYPGILFTIAVVAQPPKSGGPGSPTVLYLPLVENV